MLSRIRRILIYWLNILFRKILINIMFLLEYFNKISTYLENDSIPALGRLALGNFILCSLLLLSFINIVTYFMIIIGLDSNNKLLNKIRQNKLLGKIIKLYKESRIYFIIFELVFFISLNIFILWQSYRLFSFYI